MTYPCHSFPTNTKPCLPRWFPRLHGSPAQWSSVPCIPGGLDRVSIVYIRHGVRPQPNAHTLLLTTRVVLSSLRAQVIVSCPRACLDCLQLRLHTDIPDAHDRREG